MKTISVLTIILVTVVSSWILGIRMKRRIKRTLGRTVDSESQLTSLTTWMQAEDEEERRRGGKLV